MLKLLLKKQLTEIFRNYFYNAKKNSARSKAGIIGYILLFVIIMVGLFMLLMIWRDDLSEGYKKPTGLRICMTISYIFAVIMTISGLSTQIPKILALFH